MLLDTAASTTTSIVIGRRDTQRRARHQVKAHLKELVQRKSDPGTMAIGTNRADNMVLELPARQSTNSSVVRM